MRTFFNGLIIGCLLLGMAMYQSIPALASDQIMIDEITSESDLARDVTGSWLPSSSMNFARSNHTATLLPDGSVLVAGGVNSTGFLDSAEVYNPETGEWVEVAPMATARQYHTATLLPNGKVLITGGDNIGWSSALTSAELYDPSTGTWSPTGYMNQARFYHTAVLLTNGKVLVVGGAQGAGDFLASVELYDPVSGTWETTGSISHQRVRHVTTLLPDGKVMVVGGNNIKAVELYNPDTGLWTPTSPISNYRIDPSVTLMPNGKVILAGKVGAGNDPYYEVYDPVTGEWAFSGKEMVESRTRHTATLLPNGKLLVTGGSFDASYLPTTELYDPVTDLWTAAPSMSTARSLHTATLLPNGNVLVAGGKQQPDGICLSSAELYQPHAGGWTTTDSLVTARSRHTATLLPDGKVLVVGGVDGADTFDSAELYNPITDSWESAGEMSATRWGHIAILLPNGKVLVAGGFFEPNNVLGSAELFNPDTGEWESTGFMITARYGACAALLPNGKVLVFGGWSSTTTHTNNVELYDPSTGTWEAVQPMNKSRVNFSSTVLSDGRVLAVGGTSNQNAEVYDPSTGEWTTTVDMNVGRVGHTATLLADGRVLVVGGINGIYAEIYDPIAEVWDLIEEENHNRRYHTATLMTDGQVLVTGGYDGSSTINNVQLYNPVTGKWSDASPLAENREYHTATILLSGEVFIAAGGPVTNPLSSTEIFDRGLGFDVAWQPTIGVLGENVDTGDLLEVTGTGFRGFTHTEASSGATYSSATNYPLVQIRRLDNGQMTWLPTSEFTKTSFALVIADDINPGPTALTVFVNGIPSISTILNITKTMGEAPEITSEDYTTFTVGVEDSFEVQATGQPLPLITVDETLSDALPEGLVFTPGTGSAILTGTPAVGMGGIYDLVFVASNGVGSGDQQSFTLIVEEAPWFTSEPTAIISVGKLEDLNLTAMGMPLPTITLEANSGGDVLPDGMSFYAGTGSATLSGTPTEGSGGIYELVFIASNGIEPDAVQTFTLIVQTVADIDEGGGTITSNEGSIEIQVQPGAVAGVSTFTLLPQAEPTESTGSLTFAGISFQLTAEDGEGNPITIFDAPLMITIMYDPDALGEIDPETLRLYKWDGDEWVDAICDGEDYERGEHWFSLPICHLCEFAVLGEMSSGYKIFLPLILH
jgi:WD40 repeat protein